ncbi:Serine/threonine-protein kinase PLK [Aphelenchoides besseyi]|nr:Serine/threonine-protein kinase PLK [Aphelenchoides besseyi]KAI6193286.1 Serine/threonine-protein kinase PLK [Aphelenchoides besseyi]
MAPTTTSTKPTLKEVPSIVNGKHGGRMVAFERGRFLGKGGFARCYELIDKAKERVYAGKVISKTILIKKSQRDKVMQEVMIHATLKHPNVVRLDGHFEDADNVYVLLELCARRSLMELHKRRRTVTEPEARYFTHQVVAGCQYLHNLKIIHRDLKLGNLFLNDDMVLKIGDFGLATKVEFDGQQKQTLCGTPNYIAPEMLLKMGHSYGVDVWAIGCILYTLLVGKPPFETESLKIRRNEYIIPTRIGQHAHEIIAALLAPQPENRPSVFEIPKYKFFSRGFMPDALPVSCLVSAPRFNHENVSGGMIEPDTRLGNVLQPAAGTRHEPVQDAASMIVHNRKGNENDEIPIIEHLNNMAIQLSPFYYKPGEPTQNYELSVHDEHPASAPVFWVSKWVDYSNKYGLSYQLCDDTVGCLFNDNTKILVDPTGNQMQYVDVTGTESYYTSVQYPSTLEKKVVLLKYFRSYMMKHLLAAGESLPRRGQEFARFPWLSSWFRTSSAIVLLMTDGTLQLNFFADHTKIIVCPQMQAVTFIDNNRLPHTYKLQHLNEVGCSHELRKRLKYAKTMVDRLLNRGTNGALCNSATETN